ncbi:MAG TPA: tetratricopeptide repeat protein [Candidatus Xenobia bacterium]
MSLRRSGWKSVPALRGQEKHQDEVLVLGFPVVNDKDVAGFGGQRHIAVELPSCLRLEGLMAHEFGHALLGFSHTDGKADVLDGLSVMASSWFMTYYSDRQKQLCVRTLQAMRLASQGRVCLRKGRFRDAAALLTRSLEHNPYLGRAADVERCWQRSLLGDLQGSTLHYYRAQALRLLGRWTEALEHCQASASKKQIAPRRWLDIGYCSWMAGDLEQAQDAFHRTVQQDGPLLPLGRIAHLWLRWMEEPSAADLPRLVRSMVRRQPYSVPALHLLVLLFPGHPLAARLRRLSPASL